MTTPAQQALFDNISPHMRGSLARDAVSEYRRWAIGQTAAALRANDQERLKELDILKDKLAEDFSAVISGDQEAIHRALTEYRPFLAEANKGNSPQNHITGGLNGGPA
jgi:hypothetical protein